MANVVVLTHFVAAFSSSSDDQNCQDSDAILKLHRADSIFFFHVMSWFYLPRQEWLHALLGLAVARDSDEVDGAATI